MPSRTKTKARKAKRSAATAKARKRRSRPAAARKSLAVKVSPTALPAPSLSREVVEEILIHSAKASESPPLSDDALSEIAICANLDPGAVLDAHNRLREAVEASDVTVLRVVGLWDPYD